MQVISEYRSMTEKDLNEALLKLRRQQFDMRMQRASGALTKTHSFKQIRRSIARIKTILTEQAGKNHDN